MSAQVMHSKRPHDWSASEANGRGKRHRSTYFTSQNTSFKITPGSIVFRVLCPASKTGRVIGKGGDKITQIRQETGAKVRVEEVVPGCDERVVVIAGSSKENESYIDQSKINDKDNELSGDRSKNEDKENDPTSDQSKNDEKENEPSSDQSKSDDKENEPSSNQIKIDHEETKDTQAAEVTNKTDENDKDSGHKQSVAEEELQSEKVASSIQKALLLVFERMVEGESEMDGGDEEGNKGDASLVLRLLVLSTQVDCLSGKSGSVIEQIASESGAEIQILPRDKLPVCASASDDLVQLSGDVDAVRKALQSVSQQLIDNPPQNNDTSFAANPTSSSHSFDNSLSRPHAFPHRDGGSGRMGPSQNMLTYRLICPDEKVGGVIGKGGTIVKALKHETGCDIKVLERTPESDDRVIIISGPAHPDERISAPQDAVLRVQTRIVRAAPESNTVTAKIIVSTHQIGCLLGKGGAVISEMRKSTGAYIRILGKDQTPLYAAENEEVVQINGDFESVHEALMQVTTRLRSHFFRDAFPSFNHPPNAGGFVDHGPPFPPYMGRRELSPPGRYSSFNQFEAGLPPRGGGFRPHDDRPPFMHNHHRPDFPHHMPERLPSSAPWGPQGIEGNGPGGFSDFGAAPQRRMGGFGGGNHQAVITKTTVEVVVPRSVVPAIYGEDGGCLKQIREISDAKITITDPKPGAKETLIIISGTPEQTHAAQSLIQAFVISETEGS